MRDFEALEASGRSLGGHDSGVEYIGLFLRVRRSLLAVGVGPLATVVVGVGPSGASRLRDASVVRGVVGEDASPGLSAGRLVRRCGLTTHASLAECVSGGRGGIRIDWNGLCPRHRVLQLSPQLRACDVNSSPVAKLVFCFGRGLVDAADGIRVCGAVRGQCSRRVSIWRWSIASFSPASVGERGSTLRVYGGKLFGWIALLRFVRDRLGGEVLAPRRWEGNGHQDCGGVPTTGGHHRKQPSIVRACSVGRLEAASSFLGSPSRRYRLRYQRQVTLEAQRANCRDWHGRFVYGTSTQKVGLPTGRMSGALRTANLVFGSGWQRREHLRVFRTCSLNPISGARVK